MENRGILGPHVSWLVVAETERMMRHSLEGQAIELAWIGDNVCRLGVKDYLHMCLKKTSWYSFIYPLRVGALIARGHLQENEFCRFGWYLGAAFQIQDDLLNLTGEYRKYGKEIGGDLWEGKRTLMLIHLMRYCSTSDRQRIVGILAEPRTEHPPRDIAWLFRLMQHRGSIEYARRAARQLAGAALMEGLSALRGMPDSDDKRFILEMVLYVVNRDR
jgi:geranylgeranyl diphosphate synthase type II